MPKIAQLLAAAGAEDMLICCGGVIPKQDYQFLYDNGVCSIFGPGTHVPKAAMELVEKAHTKLTATA